ncbi:MAG: hypothetical protein WCI48_04605 [Bacteroidota bacterium]|jgi:hypothetical protein
MKKIIPALLLFAMLFNTAGYYIVYEVNRILMHKEFTSLLKHGCFDHDLTVFSVFNPAADPSFRRVDEREIVYRGNLYDVVKEVPKGKLVTFYCIHDNKEESLLAGMKNTHNNKKAQYLLQHLVTIALPVTNTHAYQPASINIVYPLLSMSFSNHAEMPFSPPPEKS